MNRLFLFPFERKNKVVALSIKPPEYDTKNYYNLEIKIRNFQELSKDDLDFLHHLPAQQLIHLIRIYNVHVINITPILVEQK